MKSKKVLSFIVVVAMFLTVSMLTACGGGETGGSTPYDGKWIAVSAEALGMQMSAEEAFENGFTFEVNGSKKVKLFVDGEEGKGTWEEKDGKFILKVEGEEMEGTPGENTIIFDDMMGMGLKLVFAKEGTDAMNPENYLPEEEKAALGTWNSTKALNALDEPADDLPVGVAEAFKLELKGDHTANVVLFGEDLGTMPWSYLGSLGGSLEVPEDKYTIMFEFTEDGSLKTSVSNSDMYYTFICSKAE